ncbi:MAG: hypothetical protein U9O18_02990 [Chloroflexota bacterium]|nr:hypothetical protein [Chloroflexota bacterium]
MSEQARSEQVCPVCGQHTVALDQPPEIDTMGVQAFSDMVGMGDLHNEGSVGIICLSCGTHWRDKAAFDRNEAEPDAGSDAPDDADFGGDDGGDDGGE